MNSSIKTWGTLAIIICMVSRTLQDGDSFDTLMFPMNDLIVNSSIVNETLYFLGLGLNNPHKESHLFWYRNETHNWAANIDDENMGDAKHEKFNTSHIACNSTDNTREYLCKGTEKLCELQPIKGFVQKFSRPSTYLLQVNNQKIEPSKEKNCTIRCSANSDYRHELESITGETVYLTCISPNTNKNDATFSWNRDGVEFISGYEGGNVSSLEFKPVKKDDEATYTCCVKGKEDSFKTRCYSISLIVKNNTEEQSKNVQTSDLNHVVGVLSENFTLSCAEDKPTTELGGIVFSLLSHPLTIVAIIAFVLLNVGIVIFFYRRKPRSNHVLVKQIVVRIKTSSKDNHEEARLLPEVRIETQRSTKTRKGNSGSAWEYKLPLDEKWEFPRDQLTIISDLGMGNFGKVMMAHATSLIAEGVNTTVAVKMLKDCHTDSNMVDLVKEMEIMKIIGKHENVVNFLGCCTQDGPLYVIIEYAEHGSLVNFLRRHRPENDGYELPTNLNLKLNKKLSLKSLVSFAYQIARGMKYLSSNRCVHRDLAARNILVSDDYIMKIADFGLARDIGSNDYYLKRDDCQLPIKWMAPECINLRKFSSLSDVWSYGILLWEIMTLGEVPYPTFTKIEQLFGMIKLGGRMEKPPSCPLEIYKIMLACWSWNPEQRPKFSDLVDQFDAILLKVSDKEYLDLEPEPEEDSEENDRDTENEDDEETRFDGKDVSRKKKVFYQNTLEVLSDGGFYSDDQLEKDQDETEFPFSQSVHMRKGHEEANVDYLELLVKENPKKK